MEVLRTRYTLGKYTWGAGRFVGKSFTPLEDGSIRTDQEFYTVYTTSRAQEIPLSRDRKRRRYAPCTVSEVEHSVPYLVLWLG